MISMSLSIISNSKLKNAKDTKSHSIYLLTNKPAAAGLNEDNTLCIN